MKTCTYCREQKPESEFHKNRHSPDGLEYRCKPCACAYQRTRHPHRYSKYTSYFRVRDAHKQAVIRHAPVNDLTIEQWDTIVDQYGGRCAYCDKWAEQIGIDHVIPFSRGGGNTASNVVPCCTHCNSTKWARLPEEAGMINPLRQLREYEQLALL